MRRTESPYDDGWAIARLREVWEWAVAQNRHFVAYLLGMAILAFELDDGRGKFKAAKDAPDAAVRPRAKTDVKS
jgi:hypothetical protein